MSGFQVKNKDGSFKILYNIGGPFIKITNIKNGLSPATAGDSAYQIKTDYPSSTDDLYWIKNDNINEGKPFQIYADMTTDGGGWTLLMTNSSGGVWVYTDIFKKNFSSPSISNNYSIVGYGDYLKRDGAVFQYMLDATSRGRYGGIWSAPSSYSFIKTDNSQINVTLDTKFGTWNYNDQSIEQRMPWMSHDCALLTTSNDSAGNWWGTLISSCGFSPAPWIEGDPGPEGNNNSPGIIWYWVR
jgi:hypothetical protein